MRLTPKLLGFLNRIFDKDPDPFVALRVRYEGDLSWAVAEGTLALTVTGGLGQSVTYDLSAYSLQGLVNAIAARTGFSVTFIDPDRRDLSALVLLDGANDQANSNGDALLGYTSLLWAFFEAWAVQLQGLRDQVAQMLRQMSTTTAEDYWLEQLGDQYGVKKQVGESDPIYAQRIIAEVLRPVANNVAIEAAIEHFTGQPCTVDDVTIYRGLFPVYNGAIEYDGTYDYATVGLPEYGLFDVTVAYDLLLGGDPTAFLDQMRAIVDKLRAGGTFLRALALAAAMPITDSAAAPSDDFSRLVSAVGLADSQTAPSEAISAINVGAGLMSDSASGPTDDATGTITGTIDDGQGGVIVDENGNPILIPISALFV